MVAWSNHRLALLISVGALLLFVPGLGAVHLFDWDELNFAEIAREMLVSGDWSRPQMAFEPFHEKPPLFMWMQAVCMRLLGVGEFAARLPNAICGAITLPVLFLIGVRERGRVFGLLWVLAYVGSILPQLYFHSGIIDPWFNLFIFLGLYAFIRCAREASRVRAVLSGLALGLAVMTKGPAALIIFGLTFFCFWALRRFRVFFRWRDVLILVAALLFTTGLWFGVDHLRNGPAFSVAFFERQMALFTEEDAGHGGFFGYHFVVLLIGCFPASLFAVQELLKPTRDEGAERDLRRWMAILFWVVLILFSIVNTKIVHYSSLCYFPLTFLAALRLEHIWQRNEGFGWTRFALGILGNLITLIVVVVPILGMNIDVPRQLVEQDAFARGNLEAEVHWNWWACIAGLVLFGALTAAHFLHQAGRFRQSLLVSFLGTIAFVWATLFFLVDNIEAYSQRAAVEFFEDKQGERCWLLTKGYKSYVPEFYGRMHEAQPAEDMLLTGPIDRPVYLSCKVTHVDEVTAIGTFTETGRKNGFVFFRRDP